MLKIDFYSCNKFQFLKCYSFILEVNSIEKPFLEMGIYRVSCSEKSLSLKRVINFVLFVAPVFSYNLEQ